MKPGFLSSYFMGVASKTLTSVEIDSLASNQHELNGVAALREMLGSERRSFPTHLIYLADDDVVTIEADAVLAWYDARERHPVRSEWRLYYPRTPVTEAANPGDLLVIGRRPDDTLLMIIAAAGSTVVSQLEWLFDLEPGPAGFVGRVDLETEHDQLGYAAQRVLETLGLEVEVDPGAENWLEYMVDRFGDSFPATRTFSAFARETLSGLDAREDPDAALVAWSEREDDLFRTFERYLVAERLRDGFGEDVEAFITYSLSVQNRRKSRAGHALEHHVAQVLDVNGIVYERKGRTEGQSSPDFLFPSGHAYHDPEIDAALLSMLGAKSTCKDRWRQVLAEADRVEEKLLLTLEPRISENQTAEMMARRLQLVLPRTLHETYRPEQQTWLLDIRGMMNLLLVRQERLGL